MKYHLASPFFSQHPNIQLCIHFYTAGIKLNVYQIKAMNVIIYGMKTAYQCGQNASITILTIKPIGMIIQQILLSKVLVICFHYSLNVLINIVEQKVANTPIIHKA